MKYVKLIGCLFSLSFYTVAIGQNEKDATNDLKQKSHSDDTIEKVEKLLDSAWNSMKSSPKHVEKLIDEALIISKEMQYQKGIADSYTASGGAAFLKKENDKAEEFFNKAMIIRKEIGDVKGIGNILNNLAMIKRRRGDYVGSIEYHLNSIGIREQMQDSSSLVTNYMNIGVLYNNLRYSEKAKEYLFKAKALAENLGMQSMLGMIYSNLSITESQLGNYNVSISHLTKSLVIREEIGDVVGKAVTLNNLGDVHLKKGEWTLAKGFFERARAIESKMGLQDVKEESLEGLALVNLHLGNYALALTYAEEALEVSKRNNNPLKLRESLLAISSIHYALNNFKIANEYRNEYQKLLDKTTGDKLRIQIAETQSRFENLKQEQEIALLEQTKNAQIVQIGYQRILIGIVSIALLFLGLLYYRLRKAKNKVSVINLQLEEQTIELQQLNQTKNKLLSIVAHDFRNPLNQLAGFVNLLINHDHTLNKEEFKDLARKIGFSVRSTIVMSENLLTWANRQMRGVRSHPKNIDLSELLNQAICEVETMAQSKEIKLIFENKTKVCIHAVAAELEIVFRNLLINAIKFSNINSEVIISTRCANGQVLVKIQDHGTGMSEEVQKGLFHFEQNSSQNGTNGEKGSGLGLLIVHDFIHENEGQITVNSVLNKGSIFTIAFPINED